ncbi:MAG: acetyl-CoA carboxylase biotin carboxyl carrier protein [Pseudomonadota bacterium]
MAGKKAAFDAKFIRELADILDDTDLNEVEIEDGDTRIRLSRGMNEMMAPTVVQAAAPAPVAAAAPTPAAPAPAAPAPSESAAPAAAGGTTVKSPMVGTAYHSPAPGADPFVKVGDTVKEGQTILIIEAMKTMNQIPSTEDGVVAAINVDDGQPVEFGEPLITLK